MNDHLLELLALCEIKHSGTFQSILEATQKLWLLSPGEKEHIEGTTYPLHAADRIKELAYELGYGYEVSPQHSSYDYAIFLGGETETMEPRVAYLDKLWTQGIKFGSLVFHAGIHEMPNYDRNKNLTEAETLRLFHIQAELEKKFPAIPHVWIDIPLQGEARNPNTADGVMAWLAHSPKPGSCLVISSQPYISYQHEIFKTSMPRSFTIETVGPSCAETIEVSEILDSITRHFYQQAQNG